MGIILSNLRLPPVFGSSRNQRTTMGISFKACMKILFWGYSNRKLSTWKTAPLEKEKKWSKNEPHYPAGAMIWDKSPTMHKIDLTNTSRSVARAAVAGHE